MGIIKNTIVGSIHDMKFLLLCFLVREGYSFGHGSPNYKSACKDMLPGHHYPAQEGPHPFTLVGRDELKQANYGSGEWMDFEITGKFQGVLFQVRDAEDRVVGELKSNDNSGLLQHIDCSKYKLGGEAIGEKGTMTHTHGSMKTNLKLSWRSNGNHGKVWLYMTGLEGYTKYWVKE